MEDPRGLPSGGSVTPDATDPVHGPTDWRSVVESESLYRSLVEQLPAAVFVDLFLPEHTKVYMSPIVEPMLGYPQASYYTDHDLWERSIHPEDQGRVLAAWDAAFQGNTPYDVEYRFLHADGHTVWLHDRAAPLRDADGVAIGWQGVMIDITAQKEAELALRLSEAHHRTLIEHLPAISYVASDSPEGETLFESPNVVDILGYERTSGGEWSGFIWEADRQRVMDGWKDAVAGDGPFDMEYRVVHADGRLVWIHDHGVLIRDPAGRRMHWQGVLVDISARVKAQQDLAIAETRYRALIEGIPAVVYEMGPDDERRTIYANPRVEQLLGYSREEWLDQPDIWIELLHPDDRETELAAHDRHSETGEPWSREYRMIAADGRIVWVHDQATLVRDERGNPLTWQGLMVDITAQKLAEEQLRLSHDELEFRDLARTVQLEEANELMTLEIAERRRAERELRDAEERYRSLVEELPAVVYLWQPRDRRPLARVREPAYRADARLLARGVERRLVGRPGPSARPGSGAGDRAQERDDGRTVRGLVSLPREGWARRLGHRSSRPPVPLGRRQAPGVPGRDDRCDRSAGSRTESRPGGGTVPGAGGVRSVRPVLVRGGSCSTSLRPSR